MYGKGYFLPLSLVFGANGGRSAAFLAIFALWASLLPDEVFLGFLSPITIYTPCLRIRLLFFFGDSLPNPGLELLGPEDILFR